jgi:hypothetical protein
MKPTYNRGTLQLGKISSCCSTSGSWHVIMLKWLKSLDKSYSVISRGRENKDVIMNTTKWSIYQWSPVTHISVVTCDTYISGHLWHIYQWSPVTNISVVTCDTYISGHLWHIYQWSPVTHISVVTCDTYNT